MFEALLLLLVGLGVPLVLYLFIRRETDGQRTLSRADAESYARDRAADRYGHERNDERD